MVELDKIKLRLSLVASVMNHAGHNGLLNYLSLETYKKLVKDEYVNFDKFRKYSFIDDKRVWTKHMDQLVEMGLAVKNGSSYITKSKKKDWHEFVNENQSFCRKFDGFVYFDMTELYLLNSNRELSDILFLGIIDSVLNGRSISRTFKKEMTGVSPHQQRLIEKRQDGRHLDIIEHHIPVSDNEIKNKKVGHIPTFYGAFYPKQMICKKSKNKKKANCNIIQLGHKLKVKGINVCSFERDRQKVKSKKAKTSLGSLNKPLSKTGEVQDWESFNMILDSAEKSTSNKFRGVLSKNDPRYMSWKNFKNYDYSDLAIIEEDGSFVDFRESLNR